MARRFALVITWLALTAEVAGYVFGGRWETPLTTIDTVLFNGMPLVHVYPWDVMVIATIAVCLGSRAAKRIQSPEMLASLRITAASVALSWLWGFLRGGSAYQAVFQLHSFIMQLGVAWMIMLTHRTREHLRTLGKVFVFATLYRCFVLFAFYFIVARNLPSELAVLTDHADCTLFASGLIILGVNALARPSGGRALWLAAGAVIICSAMALNNRRLVWLQLGAGMFISYLLMPRTKMKKRINATLVALSPLFVAYVAAGWGHPTGIFKPVGSISTMFGENQDTSSIMRDIENYNLIKTLKTNPILGLGWGNEYIEEVRAYDISGMFPQYRYLPHNSLLGALAFTGALGFAGIFQLIPTAVFLLARSSRLTQFAVPRIAAISAISAIVAAVVHMWGDLGYWHLMVSTVLGVAVGVAGCLPRIVEAEAANEAANEAPLPSAGAVPLQEAAPSEARQNV